MPRINPISISDFPEIPSNSLTFALGIQDNISASSDKYRLDKKLPARQAFLTKLSELGIFPLPKVLFSIEDIEKDEYAFLVFGGPGFHVMRREPDGTWVHKNGLNESPCEVEDADWSRLFQHSSEFALFAIWVWKKEWNNIRSFYFLYCFFYFI